MIFRLSASSENIWANPIWCVCCRRVLPLHPQIENKHLDDSVWLVIIGKRGFHSRFDYANPSREWNPVWRGRGGGREEHVKSGNLRKLDYLAKWMAALSKPPSGWRKSNFSGEVQLQASSNLATSLGFFLFSCGGFSFPLPPTMWIMSYADSTQWSDPPFLLASFFAPVKLNSHVQIRPFLLRLTSLASHSSATHTNTPHGAAPRTITTSNTCQKIGK